MDKLANCYWPELDQIKLGQNGVGIERRGIVEIGLVTCGWSNKLREHFTNKIKKGVL